MTVILTGGDDGRASLYGGRDGGAVIWGDGYRLGTQPLWIQKWILESAKTRKPPKKEVELTGRIGKKVASTCQV